MQQIFDTKSAFLDFFLTGFSEKIIKKQEKVSKNKKKSEFE